MEEPSVSKRKLLTYYFPLHHVAIPPGHLRGRWGMVVCKQSSALTCSLFTFKWATRALKRFLAIALWMEVKEILPRREYINCELH